jgi:hypothetical protein
LNGTEQIPDEIDRVCIVGRRDAGRGVRAKTEPGNCAGRSGSRADRCGLASQPTAANASVDHDSRAGTRDTADASANRICGACGRWPGPRYAAASADAPSERHACASDANRVGQSAES